MLHYVKASINFAENQIKNSVRVLITQIKEKQKLTCSSSSTTILHYPLLFTCPVRTYQPLEPSLSLICPQLLTDTLILITSSWPASSPPCSLFLLFSNLPWIHPFLSSVFFLADPSKHPAQSLKSWHFCCVTIPFSPKFETPPPFSLLAYFPTCYQHGLLTLSVGFPSPGFPHRTPSFGKVIKYAVPCSNQRKHPNRPWKQEKRIFPGKMQPLDGSTLL